MMLLYNIDKSKERVVFLYTEGKRDDWNNISKKDCIILSFNDVLRSITEFHNKLSKYDSVFEKLLDGSDKGQKNTQKLLDQLEINSDNFFTNHYFDLFREMFPKEVSWVYHKMLKLRYLFSSKPKKEAQKRERNVLDLINKITDPSFLSYFRADKEINIVIINSDKILIQKKDFNGIFNVADCFLENFFYDFCYAIYKLDLYICNCNLCQKSFLGSLNSKYCDSTECQKEYKRINKNQKEKERRNSTYKKPISIVDNYISTYKSTFLKEVNVDTDMKKKITEAERNIKKKIRNKAEEYEINNLSPNDEEMKEFIKTIKKDFIKSRENLLKEYKNKNPK